MTSARGAATAKDAVKAKEKPVRDNRSINCAKVKLRQMLTILKFYTFKFLHSASRLTSISKCLLIRERTDFTFRYRTAFLV